MSFLIEKPMSFSSGNFFSPLFLWWLFPSISSILFLYKSYCSDVELLRMILSYFSLHSLFFTSYKVSSTLYSKPSHNSFISVIIFLISKSSFLFSEYSFFLVFIFINGIASPASVILIIIFVKFSSTPYTVSYKSFYVLVVFICLFWFLSCFKLSQIFGWSFSLNLTVRHWELPGSPVIRTPHFHWQEHWV